MTRSVILPLAILLGTAIFCFGCNEPAFTPEAGIFDDDIVVTIVNNLEGSIVYYTLDGSDPTEASDEYAGPIHLASSTKIKAISIKGLQASEIASAVYSVDATEYVYVNTLVPKTGQTTPYDTGDDGDLQTGAQWPEPRFTDNQDGTVTDGLTGLVWLKDASCFSIRTWANALSYSNSLAEGTCDLTDSSEPGDWRLPNRFELESLLDLANYEPALPTGHLFDNVQPGNYWSSSTSASNGNAWTVQMSTGLATGGIKLIPLYVWPVRGPE